MRLTLQFEYLNYKIKLHIAYCKTVIIKKVLFESLRRAKQTS